MDSEVYSVGKQFMCRAGCLGIAARVMHEVHSTAHLAARSWSALECAAADPLTFEGKRTEYFCVISTCSIKAVPHTVFRFWGMWWDGGTRRGGGGLLMLA